jgi:hypothetical protein
MLSQQDQQTDSDHSEQPFCALLAYPDAAHERLARSFWTSLAGHFSELKSGLVTAWKFEMLLSSALHAISASEAHRARFVLIATAGDSELPNGVKRWFETWCRPQPATRSVLAILLTGHSGHFVQDWSDYSYFAARAMECGRHLSVYTTGWSPIENDRFHLPESRLMTPVGLVEANNFAEMVHPAQEGNII